MDSLELAKSIIASGYDGGITDFCKIKSTDTTEIAYLKSWIRVWFDPEKFPMKDEELAIHSLAFIIQLQIDKDKKIKIVNRYHSPAPKKKFWRKNV